MSKKPWAKKETYPYPSRYGSHRSMVVEDNGGEKVKLEDERGTYWTERWRVDNNLADPNRYSESRNQ